MFEDGDILLCKSEGVVPAIIKWDTQSGYSHVAVIASAELGLIIEAVPEGGVRAISMENYKTPFDLYRVRPEFPFNTHNTTMYLVNMLARPYDTASAARLGWKFLLRRLGIVALFGLKLFRHQKAAAQLQKDQDYFCSELCYSAFKEGGGLDIVPQIGEADITAPGDIARSPRLEKIDNG